MERTLPDLCQPEGRSWADSYRPAFPSSCALHPPKVGLNCFTPILTGAFMANPQCFQAQEGCKAGSEAQHSTPAHPSCSSRAQRARTVSAEMAISPPLARAAQTVTSCQP